MTALTYRAPLEGYCWKHSRPGGRTIRHEGGDTIGNKAIYPRRARRPIESSFSRIAHLSNAAVTNTILHTADDAETLVRAIVQLDLVHQFAALEDICCCLAVHPNGVEVQGIGTVELLDAPKQIQTIAQVIKASDQLGDRIEVNMDISAMRKLKVDDEIVLKDMTIQNGGYHIGGLITLFFKE